MGWRNDGSYEGASVYVDSGFCDKTYGEWLEVTETYTKYSLPETIDLNSELLEETITKNFFKREVIISAYNPSDLRPKHTVTTSTEYSVDNKNICSYDDIFGNREDYYYMLKELSIKKDEILTDLLKERNFTYIETPKSYFGDYNNFKTPFIEIKRNDLNNVKVDSNNTLHSFFDPCFIKEDFSDGLYLVYGVDNYQWANKPCATLCFEKDLPKYMLDDYEESTKTYSKEDLFLKFNS